MAGTPKHRKPSGCAGCSLEHAGWGFAPPSGPRGARITIIGEALGGEEAIQGAPFVGAAGGVLSRVLHRVGIDRDSVRIANVVSCRPPGDLLVGTRYEDHAIATCRQFLQPVLDDVPENGVVVPVGATALTTVLGMRGMKGVAIKDFHGTVSRSLDQRSWVIPTFHPSHLQRGAMNLLEVVCQDLKVAQRVAERGFTRTPTELIVNPHPSYVAAWILNHLNMIDADPDGTHLALDTEFAEKAGGADESEVMTWARQSPITQVNLGNNATTGITFPYREPYRTMLETLLAGMAHRGGWCWLWNKYADWDHLQVAGHTLDGIHAIDAMWVWKYLQSDLPRGLGFVAAMASDFGAWKHWAKIDGKQDEYAAADAVQTWRTSMWLLDAAVDAGMWDVFLRDWHERDAYVLRPAYLQGVPIDRAALEAFHADLQRKLAVVLARLKQTTAEGVLKPAEGYARKPKATVPPASVLGKSTSEAKQDYMREGIALIEREIDVDLQCCVTCGAQAISVKHRCQKIGKGKTAIQPTPDVRVLRRRVSRWFWRVPFNPDARMQILAYLDAQGIERPMDKKTKKVTTNKAAMAALRDQHSDDPFFQLQLDWKAVQKVDATYAVGTLARLDQDDRVHPEVLPKPSTLRDSCVNPNLQNVVADKSGPEGLASGFRRRP